jgi:hypothetical protein
VDDLWDNELMPPNTITDTLRTNLTSNLRLWMPLLLVSVALIGVVWIVRSRVSHPALGTVMTLVLLLTIVLTAGVVYCGNPFPVGIAVAAICGLLSLEWLTRKLIRLA